MRAVQVSGTRTVVVVMGIALATFAVDAIAVDEVIVTTRKREENLQQVPIAVEALTAQDIEQKGIVSLKDVVEQSSSVILDQGFAPQDTRIVIRGLSPTRGRQNVAVLQDGIDVSSEAGSTTSGGSLLINPRLFDLERVEIVKGPQIALYGRSAFAGAINYVTRKPGDEFQAKAGTDIGSDGQLELSGSVDGPLTESLSAGLSGMVWSHDGFYENTRTGENAGDSEGTSIAGTAVWKITDSLTATGRIENLNDEFGVSPYVNMAFNTDFIVPNSAQQPFDPDGAGPIVGFAPLVSPSIGSVRGVSGETPDGDDLVLALSEDPRTCDPNVPNDGRIGCRNYGGSERDITRATLDLEWDLGGVSVTSLTHYADGSTSQAEGSEDVSASTSAVVGELFLDQDTQLFSQEFRVASNGEGRVNWLAGGLFWQEKVDVLDGSHTCLNYTGVFAGFPGGPQPCGPYLADISASAPLDVPGDGLTPLNADRWSRDTDHYSLFGLVEWEFIDNFKLTLEGRQTWEDVEALGPDVDNGLWDPSGNLCIFFGAPPCPQTGPGTNAATGNTVVANALGGEEDDSFFAPKVTLTWNATPDQLYYLSWAESFKPKGISTLLGGTGAFYTASAEDPIKPFRFDQEKLDNYEIGAKTAWLDQRLRLNGAFFFQDFKNKQVSTQVTDPNTGVLSPRILNAGAAEVWGAEIEAVWYATENLTLNAAYTWLDTEYTDYKANTTGVGTISYVGNCTMGATTEDLNDDGNFVDNPLAPTANDPGEVSRFCITDYSGNELEGAPEHAWVGGANWQANLVGSTDYVLAGDFQYQSSRFASDKNQMVFPDYWMFNFRAGIVNDTWDILAYVDNAFDDDTIKTGFEDGSVPTFFATNRFLNQGTLILPDPRTYGMRVNYRFGK